MPQTKKLPKNSRPPTTARKAASAEETGEVLTLAETASYLRLPEADVVRLVRTEGLPGRPVGGGWRFLKSALQEWLRMPPPQSNTEAMLSLIGAWKDDASLDELLREIYRKRGRPMIEEGE